MPSNPEPVKRFFSRSPFEKKTPEFVRSGLRVLCCSALNSDNQTLRVKAFRPAPIVYWYPHRGRFPH